MPSALVFRSEPHGPARSPSLVRWVSSGALALFTSGCGHPATLDECKIIFQRSAEIELRAQNVTDPKLVAERTEAVRLARGEELIQQCVGKRITTRALSCVEKATTAEQVDRCLE
jgi:hypothetical protein